VLPFEDWALYMPSWQEVATTILPVAYSIIMISISYRYLPVFPQERELNPIDEPAVPAMEAEAESEPEAESDAGTTAGDPELSPAQS
jgi:molybdopterin-containing oxidoreductase family membrane subunit